MASFATPASADVPVVSATVYPGIRGSVSARTISLGALEQCPFAPVTQLTQPDGQTVDFPTTSWTVATVLSCGLQISTDEVTAVEVQRGNGAFEGQLSKTQIIDPTQYQDPSSPGALPIISANGDSGQSYYNRPLTGPHDSNPDSVTIDGPITILVWVNSQPLLVSIRHSAVPGSRALQFSGTVKTSTATTVATSSLKWRWTFQDADTTSTNQSPTHVSSESSYNVTLQVEGEGTAGTATVLVTSPTEPAPGHRKQTGGHKRTSSDSPTGKDTGGSNDRPGGGYSSGQSNARTGQSNPRTGQSNPRTGQSNPTTGGRRQSTQRSSPTTNLSPTPSSTPSSATAAPTAPPATNSPPATRKSTPTPHSPRPRRPKPQNTPPGAARPLVKGKLIADVEPLPERSSPLVRATASTSPPPTVRQATSTTTSPLAAIGAGAAVATLLGLGAWHELHGRRRSRPAVTGH